VKKLLKSVYIYGSYRKIKTGLSLFWTTLYIATTTFWGAIITESNSRKISWLNKN